jgi:hypothetical protein
MTLAELFDFARARGFYPINIAGEADPETNDLFIGTLEEYFSAAAFLGAKAIFIQNSTLQQSDFMHGGQEFGYQEDDEEGLKELDLALVNTSLAKYREYIGFSYAFYLSTKFDGYELNKHIEEEWRKEFLAEREKAVELVEQDEQRAVEKMEEEELKIRKQLLKLVKDLILDSEFVKISTQGGMKAYALEKYPQLEEIDPKILIEEIRLVNDKIKAKGLHRKRI